MTSVDRTNHISVPQRPNSELAATFVLSVPNTLCFETVIGLLPTLHGPMSLGILYKSREHGGGDHDRLR
ncbi:hypothetical protein EYC84_003518 [Monilinia fructicola]|uniref:Uncharacterized protein n=1 Tax=Monilinia fructicola TaxID=38448 RepID=A0A5M9JZ29_MONFR|nr:hypothetical protein EYC84_003518 [Monilinia fructicola]